ncbi:hypothetical protein PBI_PEAS_46 [Arthrobacter phage Peas]|uniref:Uncharacterized protein n=1 Tax=Arthrobacter phage Peas TaxID=2419965 RepID=A0A3G2KIB6_9CAUD|nr:hypothetical protein HOU51_gp46 [Arthrobacter phage Peas]AYN58733.1 hypothetical protein PBI_PEAS_46 [Arthrobacter phage Peas]
MFNRPQTGGGDVFKPAEHANELILVWPRDMRYNVTTPTGASDAIACDIVVLDGPGAGAKFSNTLLFSAGLRNNLQSYLGDPNPALGRIIQVQLQGGKTTWNLADYTDADASLAMSYLQQNPHTPSPVQQAPAAASQEQYNQWNPAPPAPIQQQAPVQQYQQPPVQQQAAPPAWAQPPVQQAPVQQYQPPVQVNTSTGEVAPQQGYQQPAQQAPVQQYQQPPVQQQAPQQGGGVDAAQIQALIAQGMDDATIQSTTGAPAPAIAAIRAVS